MIFAKELILKGFAGLAVVGSAGAGVWWYTTQKPENNTPNETNELDTLASNVGLSCTPSDNLSATNGVQCNKKTGSENIKIKKDSSSFNLSDISGGKIKVYKLTASGNGTTYYNKNFKFVIEEADIGTNNKLEEFETYEIKEENNQWYLTRKTETKDEIKKALGLDHCEFPTNGSQQDGCDIAGDKFKKVKFDGIAESVANGPEGTKLKISKVSGDNTFGKFGYKFVLESTNDAKISDTLTIKANTNTEFKIKKGTDNKTLTLEKAWSVDELVKKLGMTCTTGSDSSKECTLVDGKINVFEDSSKKVVEAKVKDSSQSNKKLKVQEGVENHNQGFKFFVDESSDIELCKDSETSPSVTKIEKKETATYEIIEKTEGDSTK